VLHKGTIGDIYNIGTQKERSVLDVISAICKHFKLGADKIEHVKDRAFNDQRYAPYL
jgi:UDP-glucose 4,6-dehydratase